VLALFALRAKASDPKVETTFGINPHAQLNWRIVRGGKPGPLFRTMR
jgi:hypothetical protein